VRIRPKKQPNTKKEWQRGPSRGALETSFNHKKAEKVAELMAMLPKLRKR
jgi:hypothetical protein